MRAFGGLLGASILLGVMAGCGGAGSPPPVQVAPSAAPSAPAATAAPASAPAMETKDPDYQDYGY